MLNDENPINVKSYRLPERHKDEINKQIQEILEKNTIEPSDSPFNSPICVVPKKLDASGRRKWRLIIDFRKLNEKTAKDAYPLPNIENILDHLRKSKFFFTLDLNSGFHQIPMAEDSEKYRVLNC